MQSPQQPSAHNPPPSPPSEDDRDRLFNFSMDLLCVAGIDGYFRQVNPSWTRVLGWSQEELLSRPVADFVHPEDRERTLQARADLARGIPVRGLENRYLCKDGSYRWLSWQSSIEPRAATVFAVARDITERRHLDNERLVLSKLESTGILAGGIAHDFNNLLASLQLNLELLALSGALNVRQEQSRQQSLDVVQSAQSLTQKLLTFAKGGTAVCKTIDLRPLLQESLDLALSGSHIRGECIAEPDLRPAHVDETQIGQVIRNLVFNARESIVHNGTVRLHAENTTLLDAQESGLPAGDYLRISITDDGVGISEDVLPKVFDPYFSTKQRGAQKGMGLGLTICHTVIKKHGGAMTIDSASGRGTTVSCYLPAAITGGITPSVSMPAASSAANRRILVMDDEDPLREVVKHTLVHIGYTVEAAKTGEEAVELFERARAGGLPFAAVLLDLTVRGGMGGVETVRRMRELDPSVRAVLMTGYDQMETFRDYARLGFMQALPKPFTVEKLRAALAGVLMDAG